MAIGGQDWGNGALWFQGGVFRVFLHTSNVRNPALSLARIYPTT